MEQLIVEPSIDLIESLRAVGYSVQTAISDLVDNSISANAHSIEIEFDVNDGNYVALLDDGHGMSAETAVNALRFAGVAEQRDTRDLGRFGLGLKTASLSQGRCLTVLTKNADGFTALRWDIDHVKASGAWSLLVLSEAECAHLPLFRKFNEQHSGTLVVWTELDLLTSDAPDRGLNLAEHLKSVRESLSLTFHRFMTSREPLQIRINGLPVSAIDPFMESNSRTQRSPTERVVVGAGYVETTAFVLPHSSGMSTGEKRRIDLGDGMRDYQGLYVYRNRRLISFGRWHGVVRPTELSKQARIRIDLDPSMDQTWQLDIGKSRVEPPAQFRAHLRRIIQPVVDKSKRVHTFRGRSERDVSIVRIWEKRVTREGFYYEINFEHPLVVAFIRDLDPELASRARNLIQVIAEHFPALDLYQEIASNSAHVGGKEDRGAMEERLHQVRNSGLLGVDIAQVVSALQGVEPFQNVPDLEAFVQRIWRDES